ncbi:MAG: glycogen debranching enzyme N-terminal domain-containing protein [Bacteroidaceae bacterium]|nr:amylo-alpha-1,6-glucosidase [Bacteroidaceae bacterium]
MSYLRFDKIQMANLEESLQKEVLRTNRSGAYHCTTVVDCNTRKYHGLLVIPIPELDSDNHVLLSSLDETVIQHGAEFNLGLHKYQGNNFSPNGHKYIREFNCEKVPTTIYRVGGVLLKKEKVFVHNESRLLIRYTLLEAHSPTTLQLKPFLAFRSVREYTHQNEQINKTYREIENGIETCLYNGYPNLYMQTNKKSVFYFVPDWYKNIEYPKEQERGYMYNEDLYVPGYIEVQIKKGESVVFSAGVTETKSRQLKKIFQKEVDDRTPRDSFWHCLKNSAHQFHNKQLGEHYVLAGYPWFKCRARDMFISLPGLTLAIQEPDEFHSAMETARKAIYQFMNNEEVTYSIEEIDQPDVLLWVVWAIQQYAKYTSTKECFDLYGELLQDVMDYIRLGKHPNLFLHKNGLLYTNGIEKAATWMNSSVNGKPVVPRTGYVVEINALWYNSLRFIETMAREQGKEFYADLLHEHSIASAQSFVDVFINKYGYLFDFVDGETVDWSVRPNMIFTVAFDYSPLTKEQKKAILDVVTKELLTSRGLRSLSPKSTGYNPNYEGTQLQRDYAYHQGTAWPWLIGFYFEAYLRIHSLSGVSFVERQLVNFEDEMTAHGIGSIPELFDGNPPFKGRGAVSFAMSVAELLRTLNILNKYNQ